MQKTDEKLKQQAEYIADYLNDKEEDNIFVRKTRENITKEFFKNLEDAIQNPLL